MNKVRSFKKNLWLVGGGLIITSLIIGFLINTLIFQFIPPTLFIKHEQLSLPQAIEKAKVAQEVFVTLSDLELDCLNSTKFRNLLVVQAKSSADAIVLVSHPAYNSTCDDLTNTEISGSLRRMNPAEINNYEKSGIRFDENVPQNQMYLLCSKWC